jgi:hypothetical protein
MNQSTKEPSNLHYNVHWYTTLTALHHDNKQSMNSPGARPAAASSATPSSNKKKRAPVRTDVDVDLDLDFMIL